MPKEFPFPMYGPGKPIPPEVMAELEARENAKGKQAAPKTRSQKQSLPLLPACPFEGPIVEHCHSCQAEEKSVRLCNHPSPSDEDRDKCTRGRVSDKIQSCQDCNDHPLRAPDMYPPVARRHLAFHILPVAENGVWRKAVDKLRSMWSLFNGSKIVTIATGEPVPEQYTKRKLELDPISKVKKYLPPDCEIIEVENDPSLWELAAWPKLWNFLWKIARKDDAVLYCHAKGVTRPLDSPAHRWAPVMWSLVLDYWEEVEKQLRKYPIVGPLRKIGKFGTKTGVGTGLSEWHYSGNFWWARCGTLRERTTAHRAPADPWGAEAYVGIAYKLKESGSLIDVDNAMSFYRNDHMGWLDREYAKWMAKHMPTPASYFAVPETSPPPKIDYPTITIIIPTAGRGSILRTLKTITDQLKPGDQCHILKDDTSPGGGAARNRMMPQVTTSHIAFMDDDDIYLPDALERMREAATEHPDRPLIFKMHRDPQKDIVPGKGVKHPRLGQVSTQCILVPNDPSRLGKWGKAPCCDWDFVRTTLALYPEDSVVMRDEIIAVWRPDPKRKV